MSVLGTIEEVATDISNGSKDISDFAPGTVKAAFQLLSVASGAVAMVAKAAEGVSDPTNPLLVLEAALKLASDAEMQRELAPSP